MEIKIYCDISKPFWRISNIQTIDGIINLERTWACGFDASVVTKIAVPLLYLDSPAAASPPPPHRRLGSTRRLADPLLQVQIQLQGQRRFPFI